MDKSSSGRLDHCFRAINHYSTWCFCGHQSTAQQVPMQHRAQINKTKDDLQNLAAKLHEVELVINAREDLRDGRGVRDHTARTHDLGQVTPGYNGWRLIVDAALEASWAPVHELNGTLGLDRGHGGVHILWHHISLPHTGMSTSTYTYVCNPSTYTGACGERSNHRHDRTQRMKNYHTESLKL